VFRLNFDPPRDDREVLNVEDWAEIRRLHRAEGMPIRAVARQLGLSKNTVKKALAAAGPPRYQRPARGSAVDAFEPAIRELLQQFPRMPTSVIMERVGWTRGRSVFFDRVAGLRPLFVPPDPASRTEYRPGQLAQCDLWFPPVDIPVGWDQAARPPVLVMVSGFSRVISARMLPSRQSADLLCGHWELLSGWGRLPRALVWDNESAVGRWRAGRPELTEPMNAFRGVLGVRVVLCAPRDPEAKGLVERANGYLETSFLPGRSFTSPTDFNTQLADWLNRANERDHRRLGCRPIDRWDQDTAAMLELPPVPPAVGWQTATMLPRDHYVRLDGNDYSVHPAAVGRRVQVVADLEQVLVTCAGRLVAAHERCWAKRQTISDPEHVAAAAALRHAARHQPTRPVDTDVQHRPLTDYDRAFGLTDDGRVA
jgi:transposase